MSEFCVTFFSIFGLLISVILYELQIQGREVGFTADIANISNVITSCVLNFSIYVRYDLQLFWMKSIKEFTSMDTLQNTGIWKPMVWEMVISQIAPYPFFNKVKYVEENTDWDEVTEYNVNDIFLFFSFIRIYHIARFAFYLTYF